MMAITSNPLLARLFNFAIDMLVPTSRLPAGRFLMLGAGFGCRDSKLVSWTVAKHEDGELWPAERAEAEIETACGGIADTFATVDSGVLAVHDGFLATGASCTAAGQGRGASTSARSTSTRRLPRAAPRPRATSTGPTRSPCAAAAWQSWTIGGNGARSPTCLPRSATQPRVNGLVRLSLTPARS